MEAHTLALPFVLKRSEDIVGASKVTSTREVIHGLLRIDATHLVVQWRVSRKTEHVGAVIRTDRELEPVREVAIPLEALAGATVRERRIAWLRLRPTFVLTASDLRAFEEVAGEAGLQLDHPATLMLPVPRSDRLTALEFAADLNMIIADRAARISKAIPSAEQKRLSAEASSREYPGPLAGSHTVTHEEGETIGR